MLKGTNGSKKGINCTEIRVNGNSLNISIDFP